MKKRNILCSGLITLSLLTGSCATTISGNVLNEENKPVQSSAGKINLIRLDGDRESFILDLDAEGHFVSKDHLEDGRYLVEPLIPGYSEGTLHIDVEGNQEITLQVKTLPAGKVPGIRANLQVDPDQGSGGATLMPPRL